VLSNSAHWLVRYFILSARNGQPIISDVPTRAHADLRPYLDHLEALPFAHPVAASSTTGAGRPQPAPVSDPARIPYLTRTTLPRTLSPPWVSTTK